MADMKQTLSVDLDLVLGQLSGAKLDRQAKAEAKKSLDELTRYLSQAAVEPEIPVKAKVTIDGKTLRKSFSPAELAEKLKGELKKPQYAKDPKIAGAFEKYFGDIEQVLSAASTSAFNKATRKAFDDVLSGKRQFEKLTRTQQEQVLLYRASIENRLKLLKDVKSASNRINKLMLREEGGADTITPLVLPQVTKGIADVGKTIKAFDKLSGLETQLRNRIAKADQDYNRKTLQLVPAGGPSSVQKGFPFRRVDRAYQALIRDEEKRLRSTVDPKEKRVIQDQVDQLYAAREALAERRRELLGSTLASSLEKRQKSLADNLRMADELRAGKAVGELTSVERTAIQKYLGTAVSSANQIQQKLASTTGEENAKQAFLAAQSRLNEFKAELRTLGKAYADASAHVDDFRKRQEALAGLMAKIDARRQQVGFLRAGRDAYRRVGLRGVDSLPDEELLSVREYLKFAQKAGEIRRTQLMGATSMAPGDRDAKLGGLNKDLVEMARAQRIVQAEIRGNIGLLRQLGTAVNNFFRYAVVYGGLYEVSSGLATLVGNAVKFQDALKGIQAIAQATDSQMTRLAATIRSVASESSFGLQDLAGAAQTLAQAGVDIAKIPGALRAVNNLALATGGDLQSSADVLTSAQNIFTGQNFTQLADQLTGTVNISKLSGNDLRTIFNLAAQTAQTSGISSQQLLGASATLSNLGIRSSTIATGLRELILEIFNPDRKTIDFLKKRYAALGENLGEAQIRATFQNFQRTDNPLQAAFAELRRLGVTGAARDEFRRVYDIRAENVALPLIDRPELLSANIAGVNQVGSAAEGAATRVESLIGAFRKLGNELDMTTELLTEGLVEGLQEATRSAAETVKTFRAQVDERIRQGQAVSTTPVLPTVAAAVGVAASTTMGPFGKIISAIGGGLGGFSLSTAAQGLGPVVAAVTNWALTVTGILFFLRGARIEALNKKLTDLAGAVRNSPIASLKSLATSVLGFFGILSKATEPAARSAGLLTSIATRFKGLSFNWVSTLVALVSAGWELVQALRKASPADQIAALQRQVARLDEEAQASQEAFSAYDTGNKDSLASQTARARTAVEGYRSTLREVFGAGADQAEQLLQSLGSSGLEAGTPQAASVRTQLNLDERQFAQVVRAFTEFQQARGLLAEQSRKVLERVTRLYKEQANRELTAEEQAILAVFEKAKGTPGVTSVAASAEGLSQKATSLLDFWTEVFTSGASDLERQRTEAQRTLGLAERKQDILSGGQATEARIQQLLQTPNQDSLRELEQLLQELTAGQEGLYSGSVQYQRYGRLRRTVQEGLPDFRRRLEQQLADEEAQLQQQRRQDQISQESEQAFQVQEEQLRRERADIERQRVEAAQREVAVDLQIAEAEKQERWADIARTGGLLDQRYAFREKQLAFEEREAEFGFRKVANAAGIDPTDATAIQGDDNVREAYRRWQDARIRRLEEQARLEQDRNRVNRQATEARAIPFTEDPEYKRRARQVSDIEQRLADAEQESAETRLALVQEKYRLAKANLEQELAYLKAQQATIGQSPRSQAQYRAQIDDVEARRRDLDVRQAKETAAIQKEARRRQLDAEIKALEAELKRIRDDMRNASQSPTTLRSATRELQPGVTPAVAPAVAQRLSREPRTNAEIAYAYFLDKGLSPEDAAAIVGNFRQENRDLSPTRTNSIGAYGIAQWLGRGRKGVLQSRPGSDTLGAQLDFAWDELTGNVPGGDALASKTLAAMANARTFEGKVVAFRKVFERPGAAEANDAARIRYAREMLASGISEVGTTAGPAQATGASAIEANRQYVTSANRLDEISQQLKALQLERSTITGNIITDRPDIEQEAINRQVENLRTAYESQVDLLRNQVEQSRSLVEQQRSYGLPTGPADTAAREAAGMDNSPAMEAQRLSTLQTFQDNLRQTVEQAFAQAFRSLAQTSAEVARLEAERAVRPLTDEEQARLGTLKDRARAENALVIDLRRELNDANRSIAETAQNLQQFSPTLFGRAYRVTAIGPDGMPVTRTRKDENGNDVTEVQTRVIKTYGQLDQVNWDNLAGKVNKLSYAFNRLGENITDFLTNVIDTFVDTLARQIMGAFERQDTSALQNARAELRDAQAELAYQQAVKREELAAVDRELRRNPAGLDAEALKRRRANLQNAYQESVAANNARIEAANAQLNQQAEQGGLGQALGDLTRNFGTEMLKTAILSPIQGALGWLTGKKDGSTPENALWIRDANAPADMTRKLAGAAGGVSGASAEEGFFASLTQGFEKVFYGIGDLFGNIFNGLSGLFSGGGDWLGSAASVIGGLFFSKGGHVRGPGSGTSDSIPAWLSNGEYVLTAREVQAIGVGNLERWKAAMASPARFAEGGLVSTFDRASGSVSNFSDSSASRNDSAVINIIDQRSAQNSSPIEAQRSKGPDGREMINIMVRDAVKNAINSGMLDRTMRANYGARRTGGIR